MAFLASRHRSHFILRCISPSISNSRAFAASARSRASLTDLAVSGPTFIIDTVHGLGIPYYAAIPLTAVLVRGTWMYWFALKPGRHRAIIQSHVSPLVTTRQRAYRLNHPEPERPAEGNFLALVALNFKQLRSTFSYYWASTARYQKIFPYWSSAWGLLNFGVFLAFVESIRRKCGRSEGLLPALLTPFEGLASRVGGTPQDASQNSPQLETVDPAEALAARLEAAYEAQVAEVKGGEVVDISPTRETVDAILAGDHPVAVHLDRMSTVDTSSPWYDPAMATEGLSWCTDLTVVDSSNTLWITCTLLLWGSAIFRPPVVPRSKEPDSIDPTLKKQTSRPFSVIEGKRIGMIGAGIFSLVVSNMPAAILLYIIPDVATRYLQSRYLDFKHPVPPVIAKCKRYVIRTPTREW